MTTIDHPQRGARLTPAQRMRLGLEILGAYGEVRRVTATRRLPAAVEELRDQAHAGSGEVLRDPIVDGTRLGRAVIRTLAPLPRGRKCLSHSLVMLVLLARRGTQAVLVIAVHPGETMLDAHAWVELDEHHPLLPPGTHHERLLVL